MGPHESPIINLEEEFISQFGPVESVRQLLREGVKAWICASDSIGYSLAPGTTTGPAPVRHQEQVGQASPALSSPIGLPA